MILTYDFVQAILAAWLCDIPCLIGDLHKNKFPFKMPAFAEIALIKPWYR